MLLKNSLLFLEQTQTCTYFKEVTVLNSLKNISSIGDCSFTLPTPSTLLNYFRNLHTEPPEMLVICEKDMQKA